MSESKNSFRTVYKIFGPVEYKDKNSRFISFLLPVNTSVEADTILKAMKKRYHDSNHVCFAYRIGNGKEEYFRYSDDGEPSGTAGIPIYNELKGEELFNVLLVVVRYFGGIKLGTGGLTRAYSRSAREVIGISIVKSEVIRRRVEIEAEFDMIGEIMKSVDRFSVSIIDQSFNDKGVKIILDIPEASYSEVREYIRNTTKGKINI